MRHARATPTPRSNDIYIPRGGQTTLVVSLTTTLPPGLSSWGNTIYLTSAPPGDVGFPDGNVIHLASADPSTNFVAVRGENASGSKNGTTISATNSIGTNLASVVCTVFDVSLSPGTNAPLIVDCQTGEPIEWETNATITVQLRPSSTSITEEPDITDVKGHLYVEVGTNVLCYEERAGGDHEFTVPTNAFGELIATWTMSSGESATARVDVMDLLSQGSAYPGVDFDSVIPAETGTSTATLRKDYDPAYKWVISPTNITDRPTLDDRLNGKADISAGSAPGRYSVNVTDSNGILLTCGVMNLTVLKLISVMAEKSVVCYGDSTELEAVTDPPGVAEPYDNRSSDWTWTKPDDSENTMSSWDGSFGPHEFRAETPGKNTFTVEYGNVTASLEVAVIKVDITLESMNAASDAGTVDFDLTPDIYSPRGVAWSIAPSNDASIDANGKVTFPDQARNYRITAASLNLPACSDSASLTVIKVDMDIDSDHSLDFGGPDRTDLEDEIEDQTGNAAYPGLKYVVVNDYYELDTNGIPGYADGFNLDADASPNADDEMTRPYGPADTPLFVPVVLELQVPSLDTNTTLVMFTYSASDPTNVTAVATNIVNLGFTNAVNLHSPASGNLRLWTREQPGARNGKSVAFGGNFVPANTRLRAGQLGFSSLPGAITLFLEGIADSSALAGERINVVVEAPGFPSISNAIRCTSIRADVDVDSDNNNGFNPPDRSQAEDRFEDIADATNWPGKVLIVNDGDKDSDGIPDYADGYDLFGAAQSNDDVCAESRFAPIVFEIPESLDSAVATVKLDYDSSYPLGVATNAFDVNAPASGRLRIWRKDGNVARKGDGAPTGDYMPRGLYSAADFGFSSGARAVTCYIEAIRPSVKLADRRIVFAVDPNGGAVTNPPGFIAADAVRVSALNVQFVVPDDSDLPVQSDYLAVSDPRPVIKLDEINPDGVTVLGDQATLQLSGIVEDAIADNMPTGFGEIVFVTIFTNNVEGGTYSVSRTNAAAPSFWRQHPYKGTFGPLDVTIPATPGSQHIRVETSANLASNKGFDEVRVAFAEKYPPAGQSENIYIAVEPSTSAVDVVQYYFGDRNPDTNDTIFGELATDPASMVFTGSLYLAEVDLSNDVWEASVDTIAITNFTGLVAANIDALTAVVSHQWTSDVSSVTIETNVFTETDATSGIFRLTFTMPPQEIVVTEVENVNGSGPGNYYPFLVRAQGPINTNDYVFDIGQSSFDFVQDGDSFYPMGGSMVPLVLAKDNDDDTLCNLIYYDLPANTVRNPQYTTGDQLSGTLQKRANPGISLAAAQGASFLVSLDADMNDDGAIDSADGQLKTARLGKCIGINNSDDPYSGEDDLQEVALTYRGNADVGVAWVEYDDTTMKLWKDRDRTQEVLSGSAASPNWNLRSDTVPAGLYIEGLIGSDGEVKTVTFAAKKGFGKPAGAALGASVPKFGDPGYFAYIRSYLVNNNSKVFTEDLSLDGGFPSAPDFRLVAIRREKATLSVYDAKTTIKRNVDAVKTANLDAIIVANGTFFTGPLEQENFFGKWTVGSVFSGGTEIVNISKRVMQWKEKERRLPDYRAFFGQATGGTIVFKRSNKDGGNEAIDQSPLPNAALSGLIAFIPKEKEETYDGILKTMNKAHPSQKRSAMSHIGHANERGDDIVFILFSLGNANLGDFYDGDLDRGMPGGLFEGLVTSGCSVCYGLDGGTSVGVAHKDHNGAWVTPAKGLKHTLPAWCVNNYVVLSVED